MAEPEPGGLAGLVGSSGSEGAPRWPGSSALVIAAPVLEHWVRGRHEHYDPAYVSADPTFAHAHLTLLSPFVDPVGLTPEVQARVAAVLSRHRAFEVRLADVDVFPDGIIHLVPEPGEPLRRLTAALVDEFPDYRPYGGRFGDVRPHLTLDRATTAGAAPGEGAAVEQVDVMSVRRSLTGLLPAVVDVTVAQLSWYEQHGCRTLARWVLAVG